MIRDNRYWKDHIPAAVVLLLGFLTYLFGWGWIVASLWHGEWLHAIRLMLVANIGYTLTCIFVHAHWFLAFIIVCGMVILYFHA